MWIRKQDRKRLVDCKDIEVINTSIVSNYDKQDFFTLGHYSTEQRALEVLDDIQATLIKILKDADNKHEIVYVYEMPKD